MEVEFQDESGKSVFISAVEFEGFPNIFKTAESVYQKLMNSGAASEEATNELSTEELHELGDKFFESMNENYAVYSGEGYVEFYDNEECGGDLHKAIRFVIYVARASREEIDCAKKEYEGKTIGDFEIPKSAAERAWEQGVEIDELDDEEWGDPSSVIPNQLKRHPGLTPGSLFFYEIRLYMTFT